MPRPTIRLAATQDERWSTLAMSPMLSPERSHGIYSMECLAPSAQDLLLPILVSVQSFGVFIGNTSAHSRHNFVRVICTVHAAARAGRSEM
jgi:hypothetical protein